jgi:hypothetical protein
VLPLFLKPSKKTAPAPAAAAASKE